MNLHSEEVTCKGETLVELWGPQESEKSLYSLELQYLPL